MITPCDLIPSAPTTQATTSPLAVDTPTPRLAWRLFPRDEQKHGLAQDSYQIVAASSANDLDERTSLTWDSGRVRSNATHHIAYAGQPPKPGERMWWKVRVWDGQEAVSDWSEPAMWAAAPAEEEMSRAKWITADPEPLVPRTMPLFRRAFNVTGDIAFAVAHVCGLGHHELYLNGHRASAGVLEPGWTDYNKRCLHCSYEVTPLLRDGTNVASVFLGNGMYNVVGGRYAKFKRSFGQPKLWVLLDLTLASGEHVLVRSDADWRTCPGPITFSCIYGGEDYDARLLPADLHLPECAAAQWKPATVCTPPAGRLMPCAAPSTTVRDWLEARLITDHGDGVTTYDVGQNLSGRPTLKLIGEPGASVTLKTGELLDANGRVTQKNTGSPVTFTYTAHNARTASWSPRFSLTGFRYIEATCKPAPGSDARPTIRTIGADWIYSAAAVTGTFRCSHDLLNRIHTLIVAAIRSNLQSVLTDCPHREKLGWLEQLHLMGPALVANFDLQTFFGKVLADIRDAQRGDGMIPTIAPQYTSFNPPWDVFNDSPEWGSAGVLVPQLAYRAYGDLSLLADSYESAKRYVAYLRTRAADGIIGYGLGDWYDIGPGDPGFAKLTSREATATAIYFRDLEVMADMAAVLGHREDAATFAADADVVKTAYNAKLFDAAAGYYDRGSQTAQAMPLALGIVPDELRRSVLKHLVDDIRANGNHITAGDIGFTYVLQALNAAGRSDVIMDLLTQTGGASYHSQLARGATSLTEAWDANPKSSQNHLMLGHAEGWFHEHLAGIGVDLSSNAATPFTFQPEFALGVDWVEADRDTVMGRVAMTWRREGPGVSLQIQLPPNSSADLVLPHSLKLVSATSESHSPAASTSEPRRSYRLQSGMHLLHVTLA